MADVLLVDELIGKFLLLGDLRFPRTFSQRADAQNTEGNSRVSAISWRYMEIRQVPSIFRTEP